MGDVARTIQSTIEDDPFINAPSVNVEVKKGKGLFNRRKVIHINGTVHSEEAKKRANDVAKKWAGDTYDLVNELKVKEKAK